MDLRTYQQDAITAVDDGLQRGINRPLIVMATGGGKTIVASEIIRRRGGTALILAHRDELLRQAADKLTTVAPALGMSIGFVQGDRNDTHAPVVMASIQTLARQSRLNRLPRHFDSVFVDESHRSATESYLRVFEHLKDCPLIFGMTATAERNDHRHLAAVWQEVVYQRTLPELIADGYLCDLRALRVRLDVDLGKVKSTGGEFQQDELGRALMDADAPTHVLKAWQEHASARKTLVFTPTVEMAHAMASTFQAAEVQAEALDGTTDPVERRAILERFRTGETQVAINCQVLVEGYDEPSIQCVVMARPSRSRIFYSQAVGRGTRTHPGKQDCLILDVAGISDRLSLASVPNLFGLKEPPKEDETALEALRRERAEKIGELAALDGTLIVERIDPLAEKDDDQPRLNWVKTGRTFILSLGGETLELGPDREDGRWALVSSGPAARRALIRNADLTRAHQCAVEMVRERRAGALANPDAPWRKLEPKPSQLGLMHKLGINARKGMTRGEASDLISAGIANQRRRERAV